MESELKIMFPSTEELYEAASSTWFRNAVFQEEEKSEEYINRYFDTKEHDLLERKVTVRVRHIVGEEYVHTVKLGGKSIDGFSQRYEWNQDSSKPQFDVTLFLEKAASCDDPIELLDAALEPVKDKELLEVCQTKFKRKTITAGFGDSIFEICFDDGFCIAGSKSMPICEMEIELISGNAQDVIDFGHLVENHSNGEFSNLSKYGRCLALLREEENT